MSRHALGEILEGENSLLSDMGGASVPRDLKGYGLDEWLDFAVVGWDEPLQTYFLQGPEDGDEPCWWIGTDYAEIPTFAELCGVIRCIFGDAVEFDFVDRIERTRETGSTAGFFSGNGDGAPALVSPKATAAVEVGAPL